MVFGAEEVEGGWLVGNVFVLYCIIVLYDDCVGRDRLGGWVYQQLTRTFIELHMYRATCIDILLGQDWRNYGNTQVGLRVVFSTSSFGKDLGLLEDHSTFSPSFDG